MSRVIILNGVGSAGKTSLARALQAQARDVFLHVQMDAFFEMLPAKCIGRADGFTFDTLPQSGPPVVAVRSGPAGQRAMRGMRHAVAAMAGQGNDLIVDDVVLHSEWLEYDALLAGHEVSKIGVFAPLDILEQREAARGDRLIGLARWQFDRVHRDTSYDLTLDTSRATPEDCAAAVLRHLALATEAAP